MRTTPRSWLLAAPLLLSACLSADQPSFEPVVESDDASAFAPADTGVASDSGAVRPVPEAMDIGHSFAPESGAKPVMAAAEEPHEEPHEEEEEEEHEPIVPADDPWGDSDGDGLSDNNEVHGFHTDPYNPDTDGDGLSDGDEVNLYNSVPTKADTDGGGADDYEEVEAGTDPRWAGDDGFAGRDDGLGGDPWGDSDEDGLSDNNEVHGFGTDPFNPDTDGDGLYDGDEVNTHNSDPTKADTDGGGADDKTEIEQGLNPRWAGDDQLASDDPDHMPDGDPWTRDSDDDGLTDNNEIHGFQTDPFNPDTDGDGLLDGEEVTEVNSDPKKFDTDGGGAHDGIEIEFGFNPWWAGDDHLALAAAEHAGEEEEDPDGLRPLEDLNVLLPPDLDDYIKDVDKAIVLGKALFWDMQVGSDGVQACATCHFEAGADNRAKNQMHPGAPSLGDTTFAFGGPNYHLSVDDFPFFDRADPLDKDSSVIRDDNETVSSQGVVFTQFDGIDVGSDIDFGTLLPDPTFTKHGLQFRRVEPRNTPSVVNAVFFDRQFWDGRARNIFNGRSPFGELDPDAMVVKAHDPWDLEEVKIRIRNASLASQAVGPPLSDFEMSWAGRGWPDVGRKMLALTPLANQKTRSDDSVLGSYALPHKGLNVSYIELVEDAFVDEWWDSKKLVKVGAGGSVSFIPDHYGPLAADEFRLMEWNFSLFFGLAVQMYESTLISGETPFDDFLRGDEYALSPLALKGKELFEGDGKCINCHKGGLLSGAEAERVQNQPLERMPMGDDQTAVYDNGFYNIGVRPTEEDIGVGGDAPSGKPLCNTRLQQQFPNDFNFEVHDEETGDVSTFVDPHERVACDGAFKTPGLRNVARTAPYMHNGSMSTLRQVVEFYTRGGNFPHENKHDLDADIRQLPFDDDDVDALVAFLESMTDMRVVDHAAPFDHPQLFIPDGHTHTDDDQAGVADTILLEIPAAGEDGYAVPLPLFEDNLLP